MRIPRLSLRQIKRRFSSSTHAIEEYDLRKFAKYMLLPSLGFGGKYMAGDTIAQSMNNKNFSLKRNLQWGAFGLAMSLFFYSPLWTKIYPRIINRYRYGNLGVACFSTWGFEPFIFMPCFYLSSAYFNDEFDSNMFSEVYAKWKQNFKTDLAALTMYGAPVFGLNVTVIPVNYRSWWITFCGVIFSAVIIYCKVDATPEDILLPQSAFLYSAVPLLLDFNAEDRYQLLEKSKKMPLSLEDFEKHCEENHPEWTKEGVRKLFTIMDEKKKDVIDVEDAKTYFENAALVLKNKEKLMEWFERTDTFNDGVLCENEISAELSQWFDNETVQEIFQQMDKDKNGVVCKLEFTNHFESRRLYWDHLFPTPRAQFA